MPGRRLERRVGWTLLPMLLTSACIACTQKKLPGGQRSIWQVTAREPPAV